MLYLFWGWNSLKRKHQDSMSKIYFNLEMCRKATQSICKTWRKFKIFLKKSVERPRNRVPYLCDFQRLVLLGSVHEDQHLGRVATMVLL